MAICLDTSIDASLSDHCKVSKVRRSFQKLACSRLLLSVLGTFIFIRICLMDVEGDKFLKPIVHAISRNEIESHYNMQGLDFRRLVSVESIPLTYHGSSRPYYDFILAVFSGDGAKAILKRDQIREIYKPYLQGIVVADEVGNTFSYSIKLLFIVSHIGASEDGDVIGDIMYVQCPPGYWNIVQKTKAMLSVVAHFDFRYLMKADDDTYVCINRVAKRMHSLPKAIQDKVYAGVPTACGLDSNPHIGKVIKDPDHKWHDAKFVSHTLGGLDCYPAYHQGAFYMLSSSLVKFLHTGRAKLLTFTNEDVTMGSWLMGIDREMIAFNTVSDARLWECTCSTSTPWLKYDSNVFFHNCKDLTQLKKCSQLLPFC